VTKKFIFVINFVLGVTLCVFAQTQQTFKYQALARDADGTIIVGQNISVKISILSERTQGLVIYSELIRYNPKCKTLPHVCGAV